jgi:hypothetical protein
MRRSRTTNPGGSASLSQCCSHQWAPSLLKNDGLPALIKGIHEIATMKVLRSRSKRVAMRRKSLKRQNMSSMMLRCL